MIAGPDLVTAATEPHEFLDFVGGKVARYMVPKSLDFVDEQPRLPTGKLYKKALRDRYLNDMKRGGR